MSTAICASGKLHKGPVVCHVSMDRWQSRFVGIIEQLGTDKTIAVEFAGQFCVRCRSVCSIVGCITLEDVHNDHTFCRTNDRCSSLYILCCGMRFDQTTFG